MKVLLLGVGMQGRAALHDLVVSRSVASITAADQDLEALKGYVARRGYGAKVHCREIDAVDQSSLYQLVAGGYDVVIDLLPSRLSPLVAAAAVRNRVHLVNTVYVLPEMRDLAGAASDAGIAILPEFGMDPGIDLVLLGEAVRAVDRVEEIWSYGAGIPEPEAADNVLRYKVTWTFEGVLRAYMRGGRLVHEGKVVTVPPERTFYPENVHELEIAGVGRLEAFANGDALKYAELLGIEPAALRHMGRYSLRWPGHSAIWKTLVDLHLLDDEEILVDGLRVNKRRFLARAIEPHIRLGDRERDLAIIRIEIRGVKDGKRTHAVFQVIDRRDLQTGLTAMNRTVGYTASIGAQMVCGGQITGRGLLSPITDVPYAAFVRELRKRGIEVEVSGAGDSADGCGVKTPARARRRK